MYVHNYMYIFHCNISGVLSHPVVLQNLTPLRRIDAVQMHHLQTIRKDQQGKERKRGNEA